MYEFSIYQVKPGPEFAEKRFNPFKLLHDRPHRDDYVPVYTEKDLGCKTVTLESIYTRFQHDDPDCPPSFTGHSLSVSDVVEIRYHGEHPLVYYCDSVGFALTDWKDASTRPVPFSAVDLMNMTYDACIANGLTDRWDKISDYYLPSRYSDVRITDTRFGMYGIADFGDSEGVYADIYIKGVYDDSNQSKILGVGTFKTLSSDLEALQAGGELCGTLTYMCHKLINANWEHFIPG